MNEERMKILDMIERGVITAEEGSELLLVLETNFELEEDLAEDESSGEFSLPELDYNSSTPLPPKEESAPPPRSESTQAFSPKFSHWRNWWYYPLAFGVVVTVFSGWLLYVGSQNSWAGFWMACIWLPLLLGIFVITLAWLSHRSLWVHVRVNTGQDEWPRRIAISLPLPLQLGAWFMKIAQDRIPGVPNIKDVPLDEIITAVKNGVKPDEPIFVEVDNGPGQERVEVYIG